MGSSAIRRFVTGVMAAFAALALVAPPAGPCPVSPYPVTVQQPNGDSFTAYMRGDEYRSWVETVEGYSVVRTSKGVWEYARKGRRGRLVPSGIAVIPRQAPPKGTPAHLMPQRETLLGDGVDEAAGPKPVPPISL